MRPFFPSVATVIAFAAALAACTGVGPRERAAVRLAEFEQAAGAAVEDFHFWRLDGWETLGPTAIAVWTRPNEAWLIRIKSPCSGLEFAHGIGLTSTHGRVYRRFDAVLFEHQRCRIAEIRPVDGRALKIERRARAEREKSTAGD